MIETAYIIGPTVGLSNLNIETFYQVQRLLQRKYGIQATIPHELFEDEENEGRGLPRYEVVTRRTDAVEKAQLAILLPGWSDDDFALAEQGHAKRQFIPVVEYHNLNKYLKNAA